MADTNPVFRAIITAVDNFSAVFEKFGAKARAAGKEAAAVGNPWGPATEKVSLFHKAMNAAHAAGAKLHTIGAPWEHVKEPLHEVGHGIHELKDHMGELGEKIAEVIPSLGALGAAASIAGIVELTGHVAEAAGELEHISAMIGTTVDGLVRLNYIAKMTDTPVDAMQNGMGKLARSIGMAATGKNKDVAALFAHLHIPLRDANGQIVKAVDVLPKLQAAFAHTTDVTLRQRAAFALFGRAGLEMLPMLLASTKDIEEWSDKVKQLAYPFSEKDLKNLEAYHHATIDMDTAIEAVSNSIGSKLAPILTPVIDKITDWVTANREWIATGIADKVKQLADWVMKLDFDKVVADTKSWLQPVHELVDRLGGLRGVIFGTAAAMVMPWALAAAVMVKTLGEIAWYAAKAAWEIGVALVASLNAAEKAMASFNAVMLKNPLIRTIMLIQDPFDKQHDADHATQQQLDHVSPEVAEQYGFKKDQNGRWTRNGEPVPDQNDKHKPDWFERNSGAGEKLWHWMMGSFTGGGDPSGPPDFGDQPPMTGGQNYPPSQPSIFDRLSDLLRGGDNRGKVDVNVTLDGAPPGTTMTARGGGIAADPTTEVGYAFPGSAGFLTQ